MADITPGTLASQVSLAIPAFFTDAIDQLIQGEGAYIKDGTPQGPVAQIGQAVARSACRRYATGTLSLSERQTARYEKACRPYLNDIFPGRGLNVETPIQGGQCGQRYLVTHSIDFNGVAGPTAVAALVGPVTGIRIVEQTPGSNTWNAVFTANGRHAGGGGSCGAITVTGLGDYVGTTRASAPNTGVTARIISFATCPGDSTSSCGIPAPVVTQPRPIADPTPPPFRFNPRIGIDVPINVTVNVDGSITFNIGGGDETVNPFTPPGGDPGGQPGAPTDTGLGGDAEDEAEDGEELWGLRINLLTVPNDAKEYSAGVYRAVCYVYMGDPDGLDHDPAGAMLRDGQMVLAERSLLTKWRVSSNVGYNLRVTPYYRPIVD